MFVRFSDRLMRIGRLSNIFTAICRFDEKKNYACYRSCAFARLLCKVMQIFVLFPCQRFTQSASVESQETDAPGVSPMNKKGPPPGEQEKRKTTVKVLTLTAVINK